MANVNLRQLPVSLRTVYVHILALGNKKNKYTGNNLHSVWFTY